MDNRCAKLVILLVSLLAGATVTGCGGHRHSVNSPAGHDHSACGMGVQQKYSAPERVARYESSDNDLPDPEGSSNPSSATASASGETLSPETYDRIYQKLQEREQGVQDSVPEPDYYSDQRVPEEYEQNKTCPARHSCCN